MHETKSIFNGRFLFSYTLPSSCFPSSPPSSPSFSSSSSSFSSSYSSSSPHPLTPLPPSPPPPHPSSSPPSPCPPLPSPPPPPPPLPSTLPSPPPPLPPQVDLPIIFSNGESVLITFSGEGYHPREQTPLLGNEVPPLGNEAPSLGNEGLSLGNEAPLTANGDIKVRMLYIVFRDRNIICSGLDTEFGKRVHNLFMIQLLVTKNRIYRNSGNFWSQYFHWSTQRRNFKTQFFLTTKNNTYVYRNDEN